jgi:hypothetical protein
MVSRHYLVSSPRLRNLLHKKLLFRLTIPMIIAAVMLVVVIIDSFFISFPALTYAWILVGTIIGYPFGRLTKISWNSDKTQLVLDGSGMVLLLVYIITGIIRSIVLRAEYGSLPYVLAVTLLASVGGQIGRTLGMMRQIRLAIKYNNSMY